MTAEKGVEGGEGVKEEKKKSNLQRCDRKAKIVDQVSPLPYLETRILAT